jgi:hypothetical protein
MYEGDFQGDKMNGKGHYTYAKDAVYEGDFRDGKKNGKGKEAILVFWCMKDTIRIIR